MTTDNPTEAARAEAERVARENTPLEYGSIWDAFVDAYAAGLQARTHLAAQEPTDAEVQAYLAAFSADLPPDTEWTPDTIERVKRGLSAARRGTARGGAMNPEDPHLRNLVAGAVMDAHGEWVPLSLRYRIAEKVLEALAPLVGKEVRAAQRVRDVHAIDADGNCGHCTRGRVYPVPAPCETVRALAGGGEGR